jgi:hypothetical protein
MKRVAVFCVLLLGAASMAGGAWYGRRDAVAASAFPARTILYYIDPMHPAYKSNRPGKAPDCGMALVPVYDGSRAESFVTASGVKIPGQSRHAATHWRAGPGRGELPGGRPAVMDVSRLTKRAPIRSRRHRQLRPRDLERRDGNHVDTGEWLTTVAAPDARTPIQSYSSRSMRWNAKRSAVDVPRPIDAGVEQAADRLLTWGCRGRNWKIKRTRVVPSSIRSRAAAGFVIAGNLTAGRDRKR